MNKFNYYLHCLLILVALVILSVNINAKAGRGGGGSRGGGFGGGSRSSGTGSRTSIFRSPIGGGSNIGSSGSAYRSGVYSSSYRSGSSFRWSSFGAGLLAYNAMSNLARTGSYNRYYNRNSYPYNKNPTGEECTNNEDFNGTVFGTFRCPLPEFDPSAKYCCGSYQTQYCCKYYDDNGRIFGTIAAVICVCAIFVCSFLIIIRCLKRSKERRKEHEPMPPMPPMPQMQPFNNINRNIQHGPSPQIYNQMPPRPNLRPGVGKYMSDGSNMPLFRPTQTNNSNLPYPSQSMMPSPGGLMMPMPQPMINQTDSNHPPPSYLDVVKNKD